jgi:tRNA A37 threonylcarbamoyladenosine dehydratase
MFKINVKIDTAGIKRKIEDAAKKKVREKLRAAGVSSNVKLTFTRDGKINVSGSEEDIQKTKKAFGK